MDKENVIIYNVYPHYICTPTRIHIPTTKYDLAIKQRESLLVVTKWMKLGAILLSEISQVVKDKYYMVPFICRTKKRERERG